MTVDQLINLIQKSPSKQVRPLLEEYLRQPNRIPQTPAVAPTLEQMQARTGGPANAPYVPAPTLEEMQARTGGPAPANAPYVPAPTLEEMQARSGMPFVAAVDERLNGGPINSYVEKQRASATPKVTPDEAKAKAPTKQDTPAAAAPTVDELKAAAPADQQDMFGTSGEPDVDYDMLFRTTHGTAFDPKSKMDRGKMATIRAKVAQLGGMGGMTPNQFALQIYRDEM